MYEGAKNALSKVPEVTLGFWIIKILATTIGETRQSIEDGESRKLVLSALPFGYVAGNCNNAVDFAGIGISGYAHGRLDPDFLRISMARPVDDSRFRDIAAFQCGYGLVHHRQIWRARDLPTASLV